MTEKPANIQDYIHVIIRRRGVILTFFTVLVCTVLIGTLKQKPVYEATSVIQIEKSSPRVTSIQEVAPMGVSDDYRAYKDYYETQYKLLQSSTLMRNVAEAVGLNKDIPREGKKEDPVKKLTKAIRIMPIKNSQLVEITAESTDPKMSARIANAVAEEYIQYNLERNINTAGAAAEWLTREIDEQKQKLSKAELALQKYREANNINILPQVRMGGEQAAEQVKAEYARAQALLDSYAERYTEEHPKMVELKSQISSLRNKIQGMEDVDSGSKTMEYRTLEREADNSRRMYETLLTRLREIDVTSTININNVSIVDRAEVPEKPAKPSLILNMVLAVMVGLVMGIALGFFIDYLDMTIKTPKDVKEILETRFLGSIPELDERIPETEKDRFVHLQPTSPVSEHFRHLRTEVLSLLPEGADPRSIIITSADPQAGKTMTGSNFAIVMSQCGSKVLFVDADMRKPQLHKVFELNKHDGLSEYLLGAAGMNSIVQDTGINDLKVVTSGNHVKNPAELIGSKKMQEFIAEAKQMFDFVIFDSPPVISVTDAVILSGMMDASIQVVRSGKILVAAARNAKEKMTNTKAKFLGVVLNAMKAEHSDLGYYQYYKSYRYYGDEGPRQHGVKKKKTFKDRLGFSRKPRSGEAVKSDIISIRHPV